MKEKTKVYRGHLIMPVRIEATSLKQAQKAAREFAIDHFQYGAKSTRCNLGYSKLSRRGSVHNLALGNPIKPEVIQASVLRARQDALQTEAKRHDEYAKQYRLNDNEKSAAYHEGEASGLRQAILAFSEVLLELHTR